MNTVVRIINFRKFNVGTFPTMENFGHSNSQSLQSVGMQSLQQNPTPLQISKQVHMSVTNFPPLGNVRGQYSVHIREVFNTLSNFQNTIGLHT